MKNFILGIIVTVIIGAWITLAVVGVISVKNCNSYSCWNSYRFTDCYLAFRIVVGFIGDKRK